MKESLVEIPVAHAEKQEAISIGRSRIGRRRAVSKYTFLHGKEAYYASTHAMLGIDVHCTSWLQYFSASATTGQYLEPFSGNGTIDYSTMPPAEEPESYNYVSTSLMENDEKELTEEEKAREKEIAAIVQKVLKEEAEKKAKAEKEAKEKAEAEGYEVGSDLGMTATWNNGIEFSTKNKDFKFHVGGRYQMDAGWFSAAQEVQRNINFPYHDGVDFRRARMRVDGTMYETMDWAAEVDFVNSLVTRNQPSL